VLAAFLPRIRHNHAAGRYLHRLNVVAPKIILLVVAEAPADAHIGVGILQAEELLARDDAVLVLQLALDAVHEEAGHIRDDVVHNEAGKASALHGGVRHRTPAGE
jgi:hypothetical protein